MEVTRVHLRPAAIPFWEALMLDDGNVVGVISLPADAPDKPYKAKRGSAWVTQVRVGTTTRDATNAEEARLYMQSGHLQYDRKPVPGATFDDLDLRRLVNYFRDLRQQGTPENTDLESWLRLLVNTELMTEDRPPTDAERGRAAALRPEAKPLPPPGRNQRSGLFRYREGL